jgi:sec-independent protein translocase protein TatA
MTSALAITMPQGGEWLIILVVAVLLFGAKKLPDLASSMGKSVTNFKKGLKEGEEDSAAETTPPPTTQAPTAETEVPPATQTSRDHG